jgi:hypothetical protein
LAYPDYSKVFEIYTNASSKQQGAVTTQENRLIAFFSWKISAMQCKYNVTIIELLDSQNLKIGGPVQDLSNFQMAPMPFLSDLTCSINSPHDILKVWKKIDHNLPVGLVERDIRVLGGCRFGFSVGF